MTSFCLVVVIAIQSDRKRRRDKRKNELKEERDDNVPLHRLIARERNLPEMQKQWHNLTLLLKHSNATPFKDRNDAGFVCAYCYRIFQDPDTLRGHTHADHKHQKPDYKASAGLSTFVAFLDITDLKCTICEMPFITITALMEHLFSEHDKKFYLGLTDYFQPFKLTPDQDMKCCLCDQIFHNMKLLMQHMNLHYRNFICTTCGAGFVNSFRLLRHETTHVKKKSSYACRYCGQVFASESKKKAHVNTEHKGIAGESVCRICTARFKNYYQKTRHMAQVHNVEGIKCSMCDKRFNLKSTLVLHMRSVHFKERPYECSVCNMGFFIKRHMLGHYLATHTNERKVKCEVCGKAYATENSKGKHLKKSHGLTKASLIASNVSK
ncbi:gastrula zinc finger protein XlCGF17.1-like [Bombyx mandarina]|uniref:Gastrula zinc finger protein XlCGF17.1-like n=1 Tax=Bombyx mandarina TaxID=7092 RepID=A0A6J2JRK6_BOMMA|nr:gastrula zinc finger protein XlCGF17.1-like [Bombyx mandarina]